MTPALGVVLFLGAGALVVAWRLVDGLLKSKAAALKGHRLKAQALARLEKLEAEFSRIPRQVASREELEEMKALALQLRGEARAAVATLITREAAERIVNQVNAVTLDVTALKEWQAGLEQSDELEGALDPTVGVKERT